MEAAGAGRDTSVARFQALLATQRQLSTERDNLRLLLASAPPLGSRHESPAFMSVDGRPASTGAWHGSCRATVPPAMPRDVELDAVTFIDVAGKAMLRTMHEHGTALRASGQ